MTAFSTQFPDPTGMTFTQWGAIVAEQLAEFGVSAPMDEEGWKTWVCALFYVPELVAANMPTPDGLDGWQEWAQRFIGSVR
jgi:hypothetical protein